MVQLQKKRVNGISGGGSISMFELPSPRAEILESASTHSLPRLLQSPRANIPSLPVDSTSNRSLPSQRASIPRLPLDSIRPRADSSSTSSPRAGSPPMPLDTGAPPLPLPPLAEHALPRSAALLRRPAQPRCGWNAVSSTPSPPRSRFVFSGPLGKVALRPRRPSSGNQVRKTLCARQRVLGIFEVSIPLPFRSFGRCKTAHPCTSFPDPAAA